MLIALVLFLGILGGLLFSAFFSGTETAAYSSNLQRIEYLASLGDANSRRAARILPYLQNMPHFVVIILVGNNIANFLLTYFSERLAAHAGIDNTALVATAVLTPVCFVFGEAIPKTVGRIRAGDFCISGANVLVACRWAFLPMTAILGLVGRVFHRLLGAPETPDDAESSREEVLALLEAGIGMGSVEHVQRGIAERIICIEAMPVEFIAIPLERVATIKISANRTTVVDTIRASGHHHIPVYDRRQDNITGIITMRDLIISDGFDSALAVDLMHQPVVLARNTPVSRALAKLQRQGEHVGIIIDPADGNRAIGIVSVVDIVSHILDAERQARRQPTDTAP